MQMGESKILETRVGQFAAYDFGGEGPDILLVHGTGHNLEVWRPLVECLIGRFRMAAFDLRGHGQTPSESSDPEQYWRDIAEVASALSLSRPLLIGHSTGGYAVSAYAADGGECSAIVVLDGFALDGRKTPEEAKGWYLPREQLWERFRYGWATTIEDMEQYVLDVCRNAPEDWLNAGVDLAVVEAFTRRSFLRRGTAYIRRPSLEEIAVVSMPNPIQSIYPAIDLYERIHVPAGFVLASKGLYGDREADLSAVVGAHANRRLLKLECGHNVQMQKAAEVASFVVANFR